MSGWLRFRISVAVRAQAGRPSAARAADFIAPGRTVSSAGADGGRDLCAFRQMAAGSVRFLTSGQRVFG